MAENVVPGPALPKQLPASDKARSGIAAAKFAYNYPLLIKHLWHAPLRQAADQKIVYRDLRRFTYRELVDRVGRLASALAGMGVRPGDPVGVLDWDSNRFAVPSCRPSMCACRRNKLLTQSITRALAAPGQRRFRPCAAGSHKTTAQREAFGRDVGPR
jgi:hypothetical protein